MKQAHIAILRAFDELKFNLGKKTLQDFIKGDPNPTINKNALDELNAYGSLYMLDKIEIRKLIEALIKNKYLGIETLPAGHQVIKRTPQGLKEIFEKKFEYKEIEIKKIKKEILFEETIITPEDKKLFLAFDFFLKKFNDEQKKAIISNEKNILCVAGAGSGKTTVLTKRIEFLTKFKSIKQKDILAITFTKKAKEEMIQRLNKLEINNINIETFNSFCEKILKKYGNLIYKTEVKVAKYSDKIKIVSNSLKKTGTQFETFYDDYFTKKQIREKSRDELFFIFVNDIFTIIDYYKNKEDNITPFYENETNSKKKRIAKIIYEVAKTTQQELKLKGLRDFTDQIVDTLELFNKHQDKIPEFKHILIDEYQDVNKIQVKLINILKTENIFAVGDPRQAIYGWRGSEIKYILEFPKYYDKTQIIQIKQNYRSTKNIVNFFNKSIKDLGLVDLESTKDSKDKDIFLIEQDNELLEKRFVYEAIKNSKANPNEIFVLARTNRILEGYAEFFRQQGLKYTIKSEEEYKSGEPREDEIVLATIHSIKGMQAQEVYLVNVNTLSFPNKVQDNFVLSLVKEDDEYDKETEELRLFYVALSRAKEKVVITYTGNHSKFIKDEMLEFCEYKRKNKSLFDFASNKKIDTSNSVALKNMLKDWRTSKGNELDLPLYMIISNNAIDDICRRLPQTKLELGQINGLGPMKITKYGDELLRIIKG